MTRYSRMPGPRRSRRVALALSLLCVGCGLAGESMVSMEGDAKAVSVLIRDWNDAKSDLKEATKLFVREGMPDAKAFKKYRNYSYMLTGKSNVSGEAVTLPILVRDEMSGQDKGTVDWSFKKDGGGWKISAAPLP